jgi:hypothetical protein
MDENRPSSQVRKTRNTTEGAHALLVTGSTSTTWSGKKKNMGMPQVLKSTGSSKKTPQEKRL